MMPPRLLIIGQGLAGTAVAWHLHERGVPFLLVDRGESITSSRVAAGLITPITGNRLKLSWRYETFYPMALRFYRRIGQRLGRRLWHPRGYVRLLKDEEEAVKWQKRLRDAEQSRYVHAQSPRLDAEVVREPHAGFQQRHAAWLDTTAYLDASRAFFAERGCFEFAQIHADEVLETPTSIQWHGQSFSQVIWAQGWLAAQHPQFRWVPFQSALGSIFTARADLRGERRILNRRCWLIPHADGTLRAGSTYEWDFPDAATPSAEKLAELQKHLRSLLSTPVELVETRSAVRPIITSRQAVLGTHPAHPRVAFFNGLGSKGSLRAPWLAQHLIEHLLDGRPLDAEFDLQHNQL
jgi:glycine oxidase